MTWLKIPYPDNLTETKSKWAFAFFWNLNLFEVGKNKVIGRITSPFGELFMFLTFLKVYGLAPNILTVLTLVFGTVIFCYFLGMFYLHHYLDRIESYIGIQRNDFQRNMYKHFKVKGEKL